MSAAKHGGWGRPQSAWFLLIGVLVPPIVCHAQAPLSRQIEAIGAASLLARDVLYARPLWEGVAPSVFVREKRRVGCSLGWSDLTLWTAERGAHSHPYVLGVVKGEVFALDGLGDSDWSGFVNALLAGGRTDGFPPSIDCIVETIAFAISPTGPSDTDLSAARPAGSHLYRLVSRLPADWPGAGTTSVGEDTLATFTLFKRAIQSGDYWPIAFALVFNSRRELLAWERREGEPFKLP